MGVFSASTFENQLKQGLEKAAAANQSTKYLINNPDNSGVKVTSVSTQSNAPSEIATVLAYLQSREAQKKQIAQQAYNRNKSAYENAFAERQALLKDNLNATLDSLKSDYNASYGNISKNSESAMRDAYINRMNSQKNLAQNLSAQGITGGAAETTMASLENNYGNARNAIATTTNDNLSELERLYNTNRNSVNATYNDQLAEDALNRANYMVQLENDLASSIAASYADQISRLGELDADYVSRLSKIINAQNNYTPAEVSANNATSTVSTTQGTSEGKSNTRLSGLMSYARMLRNGGATAETLVGRLSNSGANASEIANILQQLGY